MVFFAIHKKNSHLAPTPRLNSEDIVWSTCLRSVILGFGQLPPSTGWEIYQESQAYLFCLEVVCGLHSPMIGETEVFGQFKSLIKNHPFKDNYKSQRLKNILESICKDVKTTRQKHLLHLGSQSYGSVIRRFIQLGQKVHFVGAGQLVEQILPWIKKVAGEIHLYCRNPVPNPPIIVHSLHHPPLSLTGNVVVVAAPMSSQALLQWMGNHSPSCIIDLRGESSIDPFPGFLPVKCLKDIFSEVKDNKNKLSERIQLTRQSLADLATQWDQGVQVRPFGWDDVCVSLT